MFSRLKRVEERSELIGFDVIRASDTLVRIYHHRLLDLEQGGLTLISEVYLC